MKLRCDLHVNGGSRKLVLAPEANETDEHLALKLSAYLLFWDLSPIVGASAKHPALLDQEFKPDLLSLDECGSARLWVECGKVTCHKLRKLTRRFSGARLVVLKASAREARQLRRDIEREFDRAAAVEVWGWDPEAFREWMGTLREKTEVYGEASGRTLNVVVNERPFVAELGTF